MRFIQLHQTLFRLEYFGHLHSWAVDEKPDDRWSQDRHYRVQRSGERLLEETERHRVSNSHWTPDWKTTFCVWLFRRG